MRTLLLFSGFFIFANTCIGQLLPKDMKAGLKGKLRSVETTVYDQYPNKIAYRDIAMFDSRGHFINKLCYGNTEKLRSYFTFQYEGADRLISYEEHVGKTVTHKLINIYDAVGNVTHQNKYAYDMKSRTQTVKQSYTYRDNLPIKVYVDQQGGDIRPFNIYYSYNEKGQKTSEIYEGYAPASGSTNSFAYNTKGEMIQQITANTDKDKAPFPDTIRYQYTVYDKNDNWRMKYEFHIRHGIKEPRSVTVRKISYFRK